MSDTEQQQHQNMSPAAGKQTALEQDSVIPLGWKPTRRQPVPVVRCVQIKKDGARCGRWSLRGYDKCFSHSGRGGLKNVQEYAQNVIEAARLRLIDSSDEAIDVLQELWSNPGTADAIKLKAATEVLDRAGIRGGYEVSVDTPEEQESPADTLKKRLAKLEAGAAAVQKMRDNSKDAEVIDAEVVEDADQPALFEMSPDEHS